MTRTELETMVAEENKGETNMTRAELETMVDEGKIREHHTFLTNRKLPYRLRGERKKDDI